MEVRGGSGQQLQLQGRNDGCRNLVLHLKDIFLIAFISLRPQMHPGIGADQLGGHTYRIARAAHASLQQVRDAQGRGDFRSRDLLALKVEGGRAGGDL